MTSGNCKQRIYSGARHDFMGHQCSRQSVDGMDGYCKLHYPPNMEARTEAAASSRKAEWVAQAAAAAEERQRKERERAEELRKISAHDDLLAALKWCVNHPGECLADYEALLSAARAAVAKGEDR